MLSGPRSSVRRTLEDAGDAAFGVARDARVDEIDDAPVLREQVPQPLEERQRDGMDGVAGTEVVERAGERGELAAEVLVDAGDLVVCPGSPPHQPAADQGAHVHRRQAEPDGEPVLDLPQYRLRQVPRGLDRLLDRGDDHSGCRPVIPPSSCRVRASPFRACGVGLERKNSDSSSTSSTSPS